MSKPLGRRSIKRALLPVLRAIAALCVVGLGLRCTDGGTNVATIAVDGGADAGLKPRVDARAPDASFVAPKAPEGWKWFEALGRECDGHFVPIDPEAALPKLVWKPCTTQPYVSDVGACQEFDTKGWTFREGASLQGFAAVSDSAKYLYIARMRDDFSSTYSEEEAIYDLATLRAVGGMRTEYTRSGIPEYLAKCQTGLHVHSLTEPMLAVYRPYRSFIVGTPQAIMTATSAPHLVPEYGPIEDIVSLPTSTETVLGFGTQGGVIRVKRSDLTWARSARYTTAPLAVQDDVLAREAPPSQWYRLVRIEADGAVTVVRELANHHVFGAFYDGSMLYWIELSGSAPRDSQAHFELWRAPYTRDIAALNASAQRIASADGAFNYGFSLVHDGYFATAFADKALVVRLADGAMKHLTAAANMESTAPFHVDSTGLWLRYTIDRPGDVHYGKVAIIW